jgi:hypothetical protein
MRWRPTAARPCLCQRRCQASARRRPVGRDHRPGNGFSRCDRRASARPLAPTPPFCASCRAVRLHMRTVEAEFASNIAGSCNLLEQALPKPALRPSVVAIVDRGRRAVFGRHVAPTASCLENVQDATDDTTIIDARLTRLAARQMWINRGPAGPPSLACTRFRRHRVRCFNGTGGGSWRGGSLRGSSSLRPCA